jgi:hypothetical protein
MPPRRKQLDPDKAAKGEWNPANPGRGWQASRMTPQKVKVETGGNSRCDREWMEVEVGSFEELTKDTKPKDCFWDVKYRWDGYAEEVDPDWFIQFQRGTRHCPGVSYIRDERGGYIIDLDGVRLQRPCLSPPLHGARVCQRHGGQLTNVKEAAERVIGEAAEKAAFTLVTLTDPRDELGEVVEQNVRVKAANSVLDRAGIKAGAAIEVTVPGYKKVLEQLFTEDVEAEE